MRYIPAAVGCLVLISLAAVCAAEESGTRDGTYTGSAYGYRGPLKVSLTTSGGKITGVQVVQHRENRPRTALTEVPKRIVAAQKCEVDAVSRATISSRAVMRASARALAKAGGQSPFSDAANGNFEGTSRGYRGMLKVGLTIRDGVLVAAKIISQRENRARSSLKDVPEAMVENQSLDVDTVTRATVTSKAIIKAAGEALGKAKAAKNKPAK